MAKKTVAPLPLTGEFAESNPIINPLAVEKPIFPSRNPAYYETALNSQPKKSFLPVEDSPLGYKEWQDAKAYEKQIRPGVQLATAGMAGLQAGTQVSPTQSAGDAVLQTAGATIQGAGAGALAGAMIGGKVGALAGPAGIAIGAGVGALTALVSGGLQSYMGVKASRQARREQMRANAAIEAKNNAIMARNRADALEQQTYDRQLTALQSRWQAIQAANMHLNEMRMRGDQAKQRFIQNGR